MLTVHWNDRLLRSFPVGLGRDGATPLGEFRIANKISDPNCFNRGEVVAAGARGNPLGASWMGLGNLIAVTSYGIHPTDDVGSIGQPWSRGCVRMRTEDAEALFRLASVGTRVHIHP